ncbi:hypothetical protein GIB67_002121 [Kingdonia uniflora]|uniref:Aminotransferase-like plant mobile domain-containing protein n=1 Tax=Kingdonia uniflora TaxID=39325 RepID=A0A7J7KWH7_9MAGN|nr:hypothetical protein GIB67_002121 [Kingdonia uniflora]
MEMPKGDSHASTLPGFRGTRDPERAATRLRLGRKKNIVEFEDVQQTQGIPHPPQQNYPTRFITGLPDDVTHIYYNGKDLTWPTTYTFLFPYAKIGITPVDFHMLTSLAIGIYPTQVSYDDSWSILSNAKQLLPHVKSSNTKSGNDNILHLRTYLTITDDREDDITIVRAFILLMMGHLWFQMANDTVPLRYLAAVIDLDESAEYDWGSAILVSMYHGLDTAVTTGGTIIRFSQLLEYWFYEYYGVGHPIVNEALKITSYPCLNAWKKGNKKKTNYQTINLFTLCIYLIDH